MCDASKLVIRFLFPDTTSYPPPTVRWYIKHKHKQATNVTFSILVHPEDDGVPSHVTCDYKASDPRNDTHPHEICVDRLDKMHLHTSMDRCSR
jgi:hypothetical protein